MHTCTLSPVWPISRNVLLQLLLPLVAVRKQLLLVVKELLVCLRRVLVVWALDDGVNWASLLAHAAVDALGHVLCEDEANGLGRKFEYLCKSAVAQDR